MRLHRGSLWHGTESSLDHACSASNTHQGRIHPAFQLTECCGTDPTGIRNGSPSHVRRASRSRGMDRRCRRRRHRRCPSPPEYECSCPASDRHGRGSRLLRVRQGRCLRYRHACHRRLPASPDGRTPRSFRCCSKCPCCFSHFFTSLIFL